MQKETITLGDREYTLTELPLRKAREFRAALREPFGEVIAMLENGTSTQINDGKAVAHLIRSASNTVLQSVDTATDLLCLYSPEIAKDREYVEDNAVGSEVIDAFIVVIGLVFPFLAKGRGAQISRALGSIAAPT